MNKDTVEYQHLKYSLADTSVEKKEKIYESHPYSYLFTNNSMTDAPTLAQLKTPILLFKSKDCQTINNHVPSDGASQFVGILEYLEINTIERACHDPWLSNTSEFFTKCNDFIKRKK